MTSIEEYYNKFNEDKRLLSRHGQVEFNTTMHFVTEYIERIASIKNDKSVSLVDIGAGTGRYSVALAQRGIAVTAVELVNHNLGMIKKNAGEMLGDNACLEAFHGDARKLKRFRDEQFDISLLLGPMYHLHSFEDKLKALKEAKRVTAKGGYIFVGYVMADYAVIKHGFIEGEILGSIKKGALNENYGIKSDPEELYDYVRIEDIDALNEAAGLDRDVIFAPDGPADYIRHILNKMSEEEFEIFKDYQLRNALRPELVGASSHTVDVLRV